MLTIGDLVVDVGAHSVSRAGQRISVTPLGSTCSPPWPPGPGTPSPASSCSADVWGYQHAGDTRLVNVHVQRLRGKVETDPENPEVIVTVRGVGYRAGPPDARPDPPAPVPPAIRAGVGPSGSASWPARSSARRRSSSCSCRCCWAVSLEDPRTKEASALAEATAARSGAQRLLDAASDTGAQETPASRQIDAVVAAMGTRGAQAGLFEVLIALLGAGRPVGRAGARHEPGLRGEHPGADARRGRRQSAAGLDVHRHQITDGSQVQAHRGRRAAGRAH